MRLVLLGVQEGGVSFWLSDFVLQLGHDCVHLLEPLVPEGQFIDELILFAFRAGTTGWCGVEVRRLAMTPCRIAGSIPQVVGSLVMRP